jgi:hypothetical protein
MFPAVWNHSVGESFMCYKFWFFYWLYICEWILSCYAKQAHQILPYLTSAQNTIMFLLYLSLWVRLKIGQSLNWQKML